MKYNFKMGLAKSTVNYWVFSEVDENGSILEFREASVGQWYVRKDALGLTIDDTTDIEVTIEVN